MAESCILTYGSGTPGADANTYNVYNSVSAWSGKRMATQSGYKRLVVDMKFAGGNGTLKWYKSSDRGTNWLQIGQESVTAPSSTDTVVRDFLIEEYDDFKLDWVNGGSAQTTWNISVALTDSRNPAV